MNDKPPIASKWNARYAYANKDRPEPAQVLLSGEAFLPVTGTALDVACGRGGNAFYLAMRGLSVQAWDISSTAIDGMLSHQATLSDAVQLFPEVRDVVANPPAPNTFDLIVVSRFLDRTLCAGLVDALKPNGVLFYQTFTAGLANTDYLLKPNELTQLFSELQPCFVFESPVNERGKSEAQFVGRKRAVPEGVN